MSDHDATREILAAAQAYADSQVRLVKVTETGHHKPPEWYEALRLANRQGQDARANLEATIRRALARGAAVEAERDAWKRQAAEGAGLAARIIDECDDGCAASIALDIRCALIETIWRGDAALVAGAGVTTEGTDGD